ncbi:MAG: bifunctional folylpolyglutamate synthase/dihydrofolate synthase [Acidobacteria bacterium]|nr:bifunctional folylpolyglutamate synthase/dihydrofolate synthase [Acidobacteriota bacterium]
MSPAATSRLSGPTDLSNRDRADLADLAKRAGLAEEILGRLEALGIRLGLDSMRGLLAALGDPQRRFPAVLVAGSNGKGSTSALLAAMAGAAGYRTGLYTSPHLETVTERLRIDGRAIGTERLGELLAHVVSCAERRLGHSPTYFEALTAAAFLWFAAERVDVAVVEVGLGGRLDATNLCEPVLSLITSISLEHQDLLGDSLAAIAREKAGILRRGRPALAWVEEREAADSLRAVAAELGAELRAAEDEVTIAAAPRGGPGRPGWPGWQGWSGQRLTLVTPVARRELQVGLLGRHQAKNLALAIRAAELLAGLGFPALDERALAAGAAACRWPGRAEVVALPGDRRVVLDAAHNAEGAAALGELLADAGEQTGSLDLLFGVLADKDAGEMLGRLTPRVRNLVFTTVASPRARAAEELPALAEAARSRAAALVEPAPAAALDRALGLGADTLVACGSIFLVGDLRRLLRERFGVPAPAADLV